MNCGKEKEDLNAIVRRIIITELKRHRKKEQAILKRAHSDTESLLPKRRSNNQNRTGLFNLRGQTFFRDLLELEESLRKGFEDKSDVDSMEVKFDETIVKRIDPTVQDSTVRDSTNQDTDRLKDGVNVCTTITDSTANSIKSTVASNILLERKVNLPCLIDDGAEELIRAGKSLVTRKQEYASKSTQTEHVYVIRTVKSCPLRKRHLPLQLQLQRLALGSEAVCSKTVYASRDFSEFIFRKASDNLIYEKSKGSRSPSYIPAPERFRWRYLTPNKAE